MFYLSPGSKIDTAQLQAAMNFVAQGFARTYAADMLITFDRNLAFLEDPTFKSAFERESANNDRDQSLAWRIHTATWAASQALHVQGDFVECGVFEGFTSACICHYLQFQQQPRQFWLYDTFAGLPEQYSTAEERQLWNGMYQDPQYAGLLQQVRQRFASYPNVRIEPGILPDQLQQASPERIAFLHLDLNSAPAEIAVLEQLYERISPRGVILLDDYGWLSSRHQMEAERAFFGQRQVPILELPTGQGLVIKP
ncbi:methyltransferase [Chitinimonas prasina]|uniref:Methyltransferase n=1 Tax=Chitinimonas prasina TaxID=1434937 RepID=A0ABQ5YNL8_9NEIS|nr:TylF/MycF/NovP-related O-methyltransferase [Chitinimonas prasina]GLR14980.1 methyltransferase [Chitinimonas prasina]